MGKGIVRLMNIFGEDIKSSKYSDVATRKKIVEGWKLLYGEKMNGCTICIEPHTDVRCTKLKMAPKIGVDVEPKRKK